MIKKLHKAYGLMEPKMYVRLCTPLEVCDYERGLPNILRKVVLQTQKSARSALLPKRYRGKLSNGVKLSLSNFPFLRYNLTNGRIQVQKN